MRSLNSRAAMLLIVALLGIATPAIGQSFGSIGGTVRDARGDAIPGAAISIVNKGTNASRDTKTDSRGG